MEQIFDIGEYGDRVRLDGGRIVVHRTDGTQIAAKVGDVADPLVQNQKIFSFWGSMRGRIYDKIQTFS